MNIILASSSVQRQRLLGLLQVPFTVRTSAFDERSVQRHHWPDDQTYVTQIGLGKVRAVVESLSRAEAETSIVIGGDLTVLTPDAQYDKPRDLDEALSHVQALFGSVHSEVNATIAWSQAFGFTTAASTTIVTLPELTPAEQAEYVRTADPTTKAGGFSITHTNRILKPTGKTWQYDGDLTTIWGINVRDAATLLHQHGYPVSVDAHQLEQELRAIA